MAFPTPRVSVVMPTYNRSDLLPGAIDSIRNQTFADWELIIVDDCSPDATPEVAQRYVSLDPRIRYIRNETNQKLPASLNIGHRATRGELITWTSDDNFYRPLALERMVAAFDQDADVSVVYADCMMFDDDLKELGLAPVDDYDKLLIQNVVVACFMYRRQVYEDLGGYDEARFLVEDWHFWLRASLKYKMRHLREDLYLYRMHEGSLTSTRLQEIHRRTAELIDEFIGVAPYAKGTRLWESRLQLVHYAKKAKRPDLMLKYGSLALLQRPGPTLARYASKVVNRLTNRRQSP